MALIRTRIGLSRLGDGETAEPRPVGRPTQPNPRGTQSGVPLKEYIFSKVNGPDKKGHVRYMGKSVFWRRY
ncbi:hypothetical protein TanjilG_11545 [Lupinus angustifolius]|uniref:Uncharacterized protein n=1 Tax=Lupinus angustifolius TaxID=3871 RepID=A0A394DFD6_LUPAN|nr:hypothetical protein TanjilG_11545 [Lupinus angustifolius]